MKQASLPTRIFWLLVIAVTLCAGCRLNETPEQQINDAAIATAVKAKLASGLGLSTITNVSVNVTNAVVTLSGQVGSEEARRKAEEIARSVQKVVKVNNNVQVAARRD